MSSEDPIINSFMKGYEKEYDFYFNAARLCAEHLETLLAQEGIRAIVTYRAKNPTRLRQKIEQRCKQRNENYQTIDSIYEDIKDLAGIRIALYFPGDHIRVDRLIDKDFVSTGMPKRKFEKAKQATYTNRFPGYQATHYYVSLKNHERYTQVRIEIQVASVLMHAWSEVEHDLAYKPLQGKVSEDEYAILDEINGLVLAGEIALERLQRAIDRRVGKSQFTNQYELSSYFYEYLPENISRNAKMGNVSDLFGIVKAASLDSPEQIKRYLMDITDEHPVAEQIMNRIFNDNPELRYRYESMIKAKKYHRCPMCAQENAVLLCDIDGPLASVDDQGNLQYFCIHCHFRFSIEKQ